MSTQYKKRGANGSGGMTKPPELSRVHTHALRTSRGTRGQQTTARSKWHKATPNNWIWRALETNPHGAKLERMSLKFNVDEYRRERGNYDGRECDAMFALNVKTKPYANEYGDFDCPSEYAEWVCLNEYAGVVVGAMRIRGARYDDRVKLMVCEEHGHAAVTDTAEAKTATRGARRWERRLDGTNVAD